MRTVEDIIALLGGLVLNLMPCVLPVLSLKLVSVVHHRGREQGRVRLGFLATAAGIAASMLLLAGALVGLAKRGLRGVPTVAVKTPEDLEAAVALLNGEAA